MPGARGVDDRGDVGAERGRGVAVRVVRRRASRTARACRSRPPDGFRRPAGRGSRGSLPCCRCNPGRAGRRPARRPPRPARPPAPRTAPRLVLDRGAPHPVGQVKRGWCAHSGEPYLATLNKSSAVARRTASASGEYADQEALRRVSSGRFSAGRFSSVASSRPALVRRRRLVLAALPVPSPASRAAAALFRA